jgi:enolase
MMKYTYKKIEGQEKQYQVTADNNGTEIVFAVGVGSDESEIDELVKFHLDFINGDQKPVITYTQQRQTEYPPISEQLDTLYHGGYDAWKETIKAIKDKYPKE